MFRVFANGTEIYYPLDTNTLILSPKLVLEMGKAGSFEFTIPQNNTYYDRMQQLSTIITVELDDTEIFRGRVLSNTRGFDNTRKIYAEGDLAYLLDSVQKGEKYTGTTHGLFRKIIAAHNSRVDAAKRFTVGTINVDNRQIVLSGQSDEIENLETGKIDYRQIVLNSTVDEWLSTADYIDTTIIDYCGGYLRTRKTNDIVYIDLVTDYGSKALQEIEFGKNILDLTEEASVEKLFTVLIPLGDDNLTIKSVNNGSDELVDAAAVAKYGRIVRTHVFDNVTSASTLLENGRRYLANNIDVPVTITVKAVDMHFIDEGIKSINVGDQVHVNSFPHEIYEYLTCTKIEYDLENPANNSYTFGNPKQSLTERYRKDRKRRSGGGGAGAAAAKAEEKTDEKLHDFYNAWINVDEESAHIDLGTLYKDYEEGKLILQRECGIDLSGIPGNINIRTLQQDFNEAEQVIASQGAHIDLLQQDTEARMELMVERHNQLDEEEKQHYAQFTMFANDTESAIEAKADKISLIATQTELEQTKNQLSDTRTILTKQCGISLDSQANNVNINSMYQQVLNNKQQIQQNTANITTATNNLGASINLVSQSVVYNTKRIASVEVRAGELESSITLKADKVNIDAKLVTINGRIDKLVADVANVKSVISNNISAKNVWASNQVTAKTLSISGSGTIGGAGIITGSSYSTWVTKTKNDIKQWVRDNFVAK